MKIQFTNTFKWDKAGDILLPAVISVIFLIFAFTYIPFREISQFDTDEGLNLMRSMLVVKGYDLYSEVSSDQPPLFTHVLGLVFRATGFKVSAARLLVLLFSTLLVWAAAQFLLLTSGKLSAILFLPLAFVTPQYLILSVSVMIGVPSIALALVSILFATIWHKKRNSLWLILSAFALACSVLIKLFTGFLAPIIVCGLAISIYASNKQSGFSWKSLLPILIWSACFTGLCLLLGLSMVGLENLHAITSPHVSARTVDEFQVDFYGLPTHLVMARPLIVFGILGMLVCLWKRNWLMLYPLAWSATTYTLLSFHAPVFYHHQLLITVPLAILAAAGVGEVTKSLFQLGKSTSFAWINIILAVGLSVGFGWTVRNYLPVLDRQLLDHPRISNATMRASEGELGLFHVIGQYSSQTNWIVTDMPMYAFRAHLPVPPELATFSRKRLVTGSLTEDEILATMHKYKPEQVLMARFTIPSFESYLSERYNLVLSIEEFRLFVRNDLQSVND